MYSIIYRSNRHLTVITSYRHVPTLRSVISDMKVHVLTRPYLLTRQLPNTD